jgi:hypothetical protein
MPGDAAHSIYVFDTGAGLLKVGRASNVESRRSAILAGCPYPLTVAFTRPIPAARASAAESIAHQKLAIYRAVREWFTCDLATAIAAVEAAAVEALAGRAPELSPDDRDVRCATRITALEAARHLSDIDLPGFQLRHQSRWCIRAFDGYVITFEWSCSRAEDLELVQLPAAA